MLKLCRSNVGVVLLLCYRYKKYRQGGRGRGVTPRPAGEGGRGGGVPPTGGAGGGLRAGGARGQE